MQYETGGVLVQSVVCMHCWLLCRENYGESTFLGIYGRKKEVCLMMEV